jgi:hypothetical protein
MMAIGLGTNRRFAMSAWKPLALAVMILGLTGSAVHADPITWPSGLDNWVIYLAAPSGGASASPPPVTYHVVSSQYTPPQPAPSPSPQPAPVQPAPTTSLPVVTDTHFVVVPPTPIAMSPLSVAMPAPAPSMPATAPPTPAPSGPVDGYINLGTGPYLQASTITTGGAQPWFQSMHIASLFGGQPTAQQIQSFDNTILQRVQQTFSQSGVAVSLTDNPNVAALHTISLVSNTASASLSSAIGMTQVGHNGFSFIDQIAPSAQSLDQLEWIVAHNISHEMMLAFGVPENYDQTGAYVDSKLANWSMMVSSASTFSADASQAISQALASQNTGNSGSQLGAQEVNPAAVPEPTTIAVWFVGAAALLLSRQRSRQHRSLQTRS